MHITLHCIFSLWRRKEWTHLTLFASLIHYKHKTSTMLHTYYIQCVFVDVVDAIISYFNEKKRHTHQKLNVLYYCSHNDDVCVYFISFQWGCFFFLLQPFSDTHNPVIIHHITHCHRRRQIKNRRCSNGGSSHIVTSSERTGNKWQVAPHMFTYHL